MAGFKRGLSDEFVAALNRVYAEPNGWWRSVVEDKDLFNGIRADSLNVYFNGASLLKLKHCKGSLVGETHFKFLLKESPKSNYIQFEDGSFNRDQLGSIRFSTDFYRDLAAIKGTTTPHQRIEAKGIHGIIRSNYNVIDTEIAFGEELSRIDFAVLREGDKRPELVFYEAKDFSNGEIFGDPPKVVEQVRRYREIQSTESRIGEIRNSYARIAANIAALDGFPGRLRDICRKASADGFDISTDVRLVIFGYDRAQQRDAKSTFARLDQQIGPGLVLKKGDARDFVKGISK